MSAVAPSRRATAWKLGGSALAVPALSVAFVRATPVPNLPTTVVEVLLAVLVVTSFWAHRWLTPRLGSRTSAAALALGYTGALVALMALSAHCPDTASAQRCTPAELANWALVGLVGSMFVAALLGASRGTYRLGRRLLTWAAAKARAGRAG